MSSIKVKVMRVALYLFSKLRFENTSIAKICKEAGVSKGLVYYHFASKNYVLRAVFRGTTNRMVEISATLRVMFLPNVQLIALIKLLFYQLKTDNMFFQLNLNIMIQPSTKNILGDLIKERSEYLLVSDKRIFNCVNAENHELLSYIFIAEVDGIGLDYLTVFEEYPLNKLENYLIENYGK